MAGVLNWYEYYNSDNKVELFKRAVKDGWYISGGVIKDFMYNCNTQYSEGSPEIDICYDEWRAVKAYILNIDGENYRCWVDLGLGIESPEFMGQQILEKVEPREVVKKEWVLIESD